MNVNVAAIARLHSQKGAILHFGNLKLLFIRVENNEISTYKILIPTSTAGLKRFQYRIIYLEFNYINVFSIIPLLIQQRDVVIEFIDSLLNDNDNP